MNNLALRTVSGIGFVILMLACLLLNRFLFLALVLFLTVGMLREFYRMTIGQEMMRSQIMAMLAAVVLCVMVFLAAAYGMKVKFIALAMLPVLLIMCNSLFIADKSQFYKFTYIYTGLMYIAMPLSLASLVAFRQGEFNTMLLFYLFVIIWSSDIGAYASGMALGRKFDKKLCPSISPKKTWVGFWGGLVCAILAGVLLHVFGVFRYPLYHCLILSALIHVAGVFGDMFESMWKRSCGVKDSGNIIPGHGGLLDRFDSSIFAVPVGTIYLALFNLL